MYNVIKDKEKTVKVVLYGGDFMSQYQDVFERYEKKYLLSEEQYEAFRWRLKGHMTVDDYGKTDICNIYFDTPDYRLIRTSLEKPVYKEKLRLRSYGVPDEDGEVFIELKKKYKGVVYKRRVDMTLKEAKHYLYKRKPAEQSTQIIREVDWFLDYYRTIEPEMYISYERIALYGNKDPNLRVTFDANITWRKEALSLEQGIWGNALLNQGQRLLEIKIPGAMPLWLSAILDELEIYPVSFSKYGRAYQQLCEEQRKGDMVCA